MKRVVFSIVAAMLTAIGLFWPLVGFPTSDGPVTADPVTILDYRAEYDVAADGRLTATETLTTAFPPSRHGIFRFWDVTDAGDPGVRYLPENISVTLDGQSVPVELLWEDGERFRVARIGDPDRYVTAGTHVYVIRYTIDGVLAPADSPTGDSEGTSWGSPGDSRFLWRVVANGWRMPILASASTVRLPSEPVAFTCAVSDHSECAITQPSPTTRVVTTGPLAPNTGVQVRADLATPPPDQLTVPWAVPLDPVLGRSLTGLLIALGLALAMAAVGAWWTWRSVERTPPLPVMYEPPADPQHPGRTLSPVQSYYVAYERLPRKALVTGLFYLAELRVVTLTRHGSGWRVTSQATDRAFAELDAGSRAILTTLGLRTAGSRFDADGSIVAGQALSSAEGTLATATTTWGRDSGTVAHSQFENIGRGLVMLSVIVSVVLFIWNPFPATIWVLPFAAFAIGAAGLYTAGTGTRRTALGRQVWSRAGGFERLLSTTSNQERLDFSARKELYTSFIPYAMAFSCADAWADKYRYATGQEPPTPTWAGSSSSGGAAGVGLFGGSSSSALQSFESSLSSSISAYSASQSSSSSGGGSSGGGSSGGGGGGGGGSW